MSEEEKMLAGKLYCSADKGLQAFLLKAHQLCEAYNKTTSDMEEERSRILRELLPNAEGPYVINAPIYFDYGKNTKIGKRFYSNFGLTVLDCCPVEIGDDVFCGTHVSILTPVHPLLSSERNQIVQEDGSLADIEYARPIKIGSNCWIASNVVISGGVEIGEGCVIGAGSVVTRSIPPHSLAAGNPCRVIRQITEKDSVYLKPELL